MAETEFSVEFGNSGEIYIWDNIDPDGAGEVTPDFMTVKNYGNENEVLMKGAGEDANWQASGVGGLGDVIGPAGATDHALARWNTGTGKLLQNSDTILSDDEDLAGLRNLTMSGDLAVDTNVLFVDAAAGRIGSGTAAPTAMLHLKRTDAAILGMRLENSDTNVQYAASSGLLRLLVINEKLRLGESVAVFNQARLDTDFNVRGENAPNLFYVDAHNARVGIGTSIPTILLDVNTKSGHTSIGGVAVKLTNRTGSNTVEGQLVEIYTLADNSFKTSIANSDAVIGVVYEGGIAANSEAWIVVSGIAQVLMDVGGSSIGDRLVSSGFAGSAQTWNIGGAVAIHFQEIGHCLETKIGTGLARAILHFN